MSATISFNRFGFRLHFQCQNGRHLQYLRTRIFLPAKQIGSREETPLPSAPHPIDAPKPLSLCFSKIPNSGSEGSGSHEDFDRFTVHEAALDEEYWTAAWLRAENLKNEEIDRIIEQVKKRLAEREYNALKRRCKSHYAEKCTCIVAVKNIERYGKRALLNSVVGTLDISIRYLLQGEKYPAERAELSFTGPSKTEHRYGYVSNVCVAKSARRHGVASKMLRLAVQVAKSSRVENVFVHVCKDNMPALLLYEKIGFQDLPNGASFVSGPMLSRTQKMSSMDLKIFPNYREKKMLGGQATTSLTGICTWILSMIMLFNGAHSCS